jgi:hypothetical protein
VQTRLVVIVLLVVSISTVPVATQEWESLGTRALGLAGAFVAVADDATAAYWNPAGLSTGSVFSLLFDHTVTETLADRSRVDSPGTARAGTIIGMSTNTTALSYYRLVIDEVGDYQLGGGTGSDISEERDSGQRTLRSLVTHNFALTRATFLGSGFSVGSTVRYVRSSVGVDVLGSNVTTAQALNQTIGQGTHSQNHYDLDVGLKTGGPKFQLGLVARNLRNPRLGVPGESAFRLGRQVRTGLAVRPAGGLLLTADVDLSPFSAFGGDRRNMAVGAEKRFGTWLAVRGGARVNVDDVRTNPATVVAFGFSMALTTGLFVDGQWTRGRDGTENGWSAAGRFSY